MEITATKTISSLTEAGCCQETRRFDFDLVEKVENENYTRAAIIKATIKNALAYNILDPKTVEKYAMQYMRTRYPECGFKNPQQRQAVLLWDHHRVVRYLKSEGRKASFPKKETVVIGGEEISVKPDVAFVNGDAAEFVIFKIGKPNITNKGRGNAFQRDMQLYALLLYGRKLGYKFITASIYFLKKPGDSTFWNRCDQNFFGGGNNIVQITDIYEEGVANEHDLRMEGIISLFKEGIRKEAQCKETCEHCKNYDLCRYTLPPAEISIQGGTTVTAANAAVQFSQQQEKAIGFRKGVCRIVAGAGSGKTKTVVERVERMLREGVKPEEILMVTFTKNGANEMLRRIENDMGAKLPGLTVSTFNAFENNIVIEEWQSLGYSKKPSLIDDVSSFAMIAKLLNENPILEWSGRSFMNFSASKGFGTKGALRIAADVFHAVKMAKKNGDDPMMAAHAATSGDDINGAALTKLVALYDKYEDLMKENGLIDYDDQEIMAFRVLDSDPDYLEKHYAFRHIIIDEFQDSSEGQIELIKRMMEMSSFESLMVVGDDAQSIYGFRDTTPEYIINFNKYIEGDVTDVILDRNFRSTPQICDFATKLIEYNRNRVDKVLVPARAGGVPVVVNGFDKTASEYAYIVKGISLHLQNGTKPEDIAVIAYTKAELRKIADLLTKAGIPSMFGAPEPMMENSRIRAILAFGRVIRDRGNTAAAAVCANALLGGGLMEQEKTKVEEKILEVVNEAEKISEAVDAEKKALFMDFVDRIAFGDEAVENFKETLDGKDFDDIIDYLRDFSMYGDAVEFRRTRDYPGVLLITAHSSKGLEWKVVYNTITKYQKGAGRSISDAEETRRLFFVSATRARDELYVTGLYKTGSAEHPVINRLLWEAFESNKQTFPEEA